MSHKKCYTIEKIEQYVWKELPEDEEIEAGLHLAECSHCLELARNEYKSKLLLETWTAKTHGELYWQSLISEALIQSQLSVQENSLKQRLQEWSDEWQNKVGGIVQIIFTGVEKTAQIITNLPQELLAPNASWQFVHSQAVRGHGKKHSELQLISVGKGMPEACVKTQTAKNKIMIQIEENENMKPPLAIIIPEKEAPIIAEFEKIKGTNFYAYASDNLPNNTYTVILCPLKH